DATLTGVQTCALPIYQALDHAVRYPGDPRPARLRAVLMPANRVIALLVLAAVAAACAPATPGASPSNVAPGAPQPAAAPSHTMRSEERRVGKEGTGRR